MRFLNREKLDKKILVSAILSFIILVTAFTAAIAVPQMQPKAKYLSVADIQGIVDEMTDEADVASEVIEISPYLANAVDEAFDETWETNKQDSGIVDAADRNWSKYNTTTPKARMTSSEAAFYNRLVDVSSRFLQDGAVDAVYMDKYDFYVTNGVAFSDLGLTKQDAYHIAEWFLYSNPQYYFLRPKFLTTGSTFYLGVYDFGASGSERVKVTNSVFNVIDNWIKDMTDDELTVYQKELSAHKMICDALSYQQNDYDQSVYSAVFYKKTVCAGYSGVFQLMCNASGIDCITTLSTAHAWNLIKLDDGQWYTVDLTWNDSLNGYYIFNSGSANSQKYDSKGEHQLVDLWARWSPVVSGSDYVPTVYDTTGSYNAPMTLESPSNIQSAFDSENSVTVSWDSVKNATGYDVEVYTGSSLIGSMHTAVEFAQINNVQYYDEVEIKVRATADIDGFRYSSNWGTYTLYSQEVLVPYNVKVNMQDTTAVITWNGFDGCTYELEFYSDRAYMKYLTKASASSCRLTVKNIRSDSEYFGRVRTVRNNNGSVEKSEWTNFDIKINSPASSVSGPASDPVSDETFSVSAPAGLTADMTSSMICSVKWNKVKNASYYELKISNDEIGKSVLFSTVVYGQDVTVRNIMSECDYYAYVRAVGVFNDQTYYSDWSSVLMHKAERQNVPDVSSQPAVPDEPDISIAAPSNLMANLNGSSCTLTWGDDSRAARVELQVSLDGFNSILASKSLYCSGQVTLNNVMDNAVYSIRMRSVRIVDGQEYYSDWTTTQFSKQPVSAPSVPSEPSVPSQPVQEPVQPDTSVYAPLNLTANLNGSSCTLTWTDDTNASRVDMEVSFDGFNSVLVSKQLYCSGQVNLNNIMDNTLYSVRMRSVRTVNGQEYYSDWATVQFSKQPVSTPSEPVPSQPQDPYVPPVSSEPVQPDTSVSAPSSLTATLNGSSCTLTWKDDPNASRVDMEVSLDGFNSVLASKRLYCSGQVTLNNVMDNTVYSVRMRSVRTVNGEEYYSDWTMVQFSK